MKVSKSVVRGSGSRTRRLERVVKGFANHRRIEILELLKTKPELSVGEISQMLEIEFKTASEHIRRSAIAGLVLKRNEGREVRHRLSPLGENVFSFLKLLK